MMASIAKQEASKALMLSNHCVRRHLPPLGFLEPLPPEDPPEDDILFLLPTMDSPYPCPIDDEDQSGRRWEISWGFQRSHFRRPHSCRMQLRRSLLLSYSSHRHPQDPPVGAGPSQQLGFSQVVDRVRFGFGLLGFRSGLSGETLSEHGHHWIGYDISPSILDIALEHEVDGDVMLADMNCNISSIIVIYLGLAYILGLAIGI